MLAEKTAKHLPPPAIEERRSSLEANEKRLLSLAVVGIVDRPCQPEIVELDVSVGVPNRNGALERAVYSGAHAGGQKRSLVPVRFGVAAERRGL